MHSRHYENSGEVTTFHFNSDFSGRVAIVVGNQEVHVHGKDLLTFVADFVRRERIASLESTTYKDVLGI